MEISKYCFACGCLKTLRILANPLVKIFLFKYFSKLKDFGRLFDYILGLIM